MAAKVEAMMKRALAQQALKGQIFLYPNAALKRRSST
jgi:hypothetical protein